MAYAQIELICGKSSNINWSWSTPQQDFISHGITCIIISLPIVLQAAEITLTVSSFNYKKVLRPDHMHVILIVEKLGVLLYYVHNSKTKSSVQDIYT